MYTKLLLTLKNEGFYFDDNPNERSIIFSDGLHKGTIQVGTFSIDLVTDDNKIGMHTDVIDDIIDTILSL